MRMWSEAQRIAPAAPRLQGEVVRVEGLSIRFRVPREPVASLKEHAIRRLTGRMDFMQVRALQDVDLQLAVGETFGLMGRNGAGKTTLLKVLARVLQPTSGRVVVRGSVAPLLDLSAGFHPELTGRENVFLFGAMLGRRRREIASSLGGIVEFAELERFLDAPLRTYSAGMVVRLGFAVTTAWYADVLLIDEVMAVGDIEFQAKCLQRIEDLRQQGATVVLVTHSMDMLRKVCGRATWLEQGRVVAEGPASEVAQKYEHAALD
jgi:ABC-type polysaccharide/polyol phosphate transport system ATPase subunit